ncbi:MAG: hypothetical protein WKG07_11845 [Hymenobacter sp.]
MGTLNNGDVARVPGLTRGTQTESGWHLAGRNPYPSPISWTTT